MTMIMIKAYLSNFIPYNKNFNNFNFLHILITITYNINT